MNIKSGKTYWAIRFDEYKLETNQSHEELKVIRKAVQAEIKACLNSKVDYASQAEAEKAFKTLPSITQSLSCISERTPVSLGLGWI